MATANGFVLLLALLDYRIPWVLGMRLSPVTPLRDQRLENNQDRGKVVTALLTSRLCVCSLLNVPFSTTYGVGRS